MCLLVKILHPSRQQYKGHNWKLKKTKLNIRHDSRLHFLFAEICQPLEQSITSRGGCTVNKFIQESPGGTKTQEDGLLMD